ncbi:ROK family protein [Candidatus Kaiserbacteria bacterium]|nr:ROK family protein [Candidatus Kaiserbacteria bacterium]
MICLIDIGGTYTRIARSDDGETLSAVEVFKTPNLYKKGIEKISEATKKLEIKKPEFVACGIRGLLTEDRSMLQNDGVLTDWVKKPLKKDLEKLYKIEVRLENDTALAGLGEAVYGAGKDIDIVVYHSISTGVGGVKVEAGKVDQASMGFEPGHQILDIDRTVLGDDITPTLENLVSGTAVEERLGVKPKDIPQNDVIWDELAEYLSQGLRNTILYWSPDVIVLGGKMMTGDPAIPIEAIRRYTVDVLDEFVPCPFITVSKLGDEACLYGGLVLAQDVD